MKTAIVAVKQAVGLQEWSAQTEAQQASDLRIPTGAAVIPVG